MSQRYEVNGLFVDVADTKVEFLDIIEQDRVLSELDPLPEGFVDYNKTVAELSDKGALLSLCPSDPDVAYFPGDLQTLPYIDAVFNGLGSYTDEVRIRGMAVRASRGVILQQSKAAVEYLVDERVCKQNKFIGSTLLKEQIGYTLGTLQDNPQISFRLAPSFIFEPSRRFIGLIHPDGLPDSSESSANEGRRVHAFKSGDTATEVVADPQEILRLTKEWHKVEHYAASHDGSVRQLERIWGEL